MAASGEVRHNVTETIRPDVDMGVAGKRVGTARQRYRQIIFSVNQDLQHQVYRMEKPYHTDEARTCIFSSESKDNKQNPGNEIEQSAVETSGSEEHIRLADVQKVSETISQHDNQLTHCIERDEVLGREQNTTTHKPRIVVNREARKRRPRYGRSYLHHTRCNSCQGLAPYQNKVKVSSKHAMGLREQMSE